MCTVKIGGIDFMDVVFARYAHAHVHALYRVHVAWLSRQSTRKNSPIYVVEFESWVKLLVRIRERIEIQGSPQNNLRGG